jgi:DNA-binding GntR family transcriptional regulator
MDVYRALVEHHLATGAPPTVRELRGMFDVVSTSTIVYALDKLKDAGLLRKVGRYKARGWMPTSLPTMDGVDRLRSYIRALQVEVALHRNGITGQDIERAQRVTLRAKQALQPGDLT